MAETESGFIMDVFRNYCSNLGVSFSHGQIRQFELYAHWMRTWNEKFNLTAIIEPEDVFIKHFADSIAMVPLLKQFSFDLNLLDVGSGAGLPGIALKIALPDLAVTLCDALRKRTEFLSFIADELGLSGISIVHGRAEDLAANAEYREQFTVVTARAVAKLAVLGEWCLPFVSMGGVFIAMKGPSVSEEVEEAKRSLQELRGVLQNLFTYSLPDDAGERTLVVIGKQGKTPLSYPRKPGEAKRHPL